jgi:hypothetical protein
VAVLVVLLVVVVMMMVMMMMMTVVCPMLQVYKTYAKLTPGAALFQNLMDIKEFYQVAKDAKLQDKDGDELV